MKTTNPIPAGLALACLLATLNPQLSTCFAQGSLTPPGAPAPTFKTLAQIEPRTPIGASTTPGDASSLFKITQPGSYYLTTNLTGVAAKHGIEITASGVTLDLVGFELAGGVTNSLDGVRVSVIVTNLAIRNGSVRNWGGDGVDTFNARNGQYQDLGFSANGGRGLFCGEGSTVTGCTARSNGGGGIAAGGGSTVTGCTARDNTGTGIFADPGSTVTGCTALSNTGTGISAGVGSTVTGCTASFNTGNGIFADAGTVTGCTASGNAGDGISTTNGSTVTGCTARANTRDGIQVGFDCRVTDNTCDSNGDGGDGAGIHAIGSDTRIEGNNVTDNDRGIDVDAAGNLIIRNSASGNTTNYDIVANNVFGPILDRRAPASAAVLGFSAASSLGTTDANANFSY